MRRLQDIGAGESSKVTVGEGRGRGESSKVSVGEGRGGGDDGDGSTDVRLDADVRCIVAYDMKQQEKDLLSGAELRAFLMTNMSRKIIFQSLIPTSPKISNNRVITAVYNRSIFKNYCEIEIALRYDFTFNSSNVSSGNGISGGSFGSGRDFVVATTPVRATVTPVGLTPISFSSALNVASSGGSAVDSVLGFRQGWKDSISQKCLEMIRSVLLFLESNKMHCSRLRLILLVDSSDLLWLIRTGDIEYTAPYKDNVHSLGDDFLPGSSLVLGNNTAQILSKCTFI